MGRRRSPLTADLVVLHERLRAAAERRGGVLTAATCREVGADKAAMRRLVGGGHWLAVRRGTYADPGFTGCRPDARAFHQRCAALVAALRGPAVISHGSAARLLRLPLPAGRPADRISVTRRPPAPTNDPLDGDVHVRDYADRDVVDVGGVPVLAGPRLVLDCTEHLPPDSALAVADAALFRHLTTSAALIEAAHRRRGRPHGRVGLAVAARADPGGRSWFESMSRWWLLEAGLPRPELQTPFVDGAGTVRACVDMWFAEQRTVGEADGAGKTRSRACCTPRSAARTGCATRATWRSCAGCRRRCAPRVPGSSWWTVSSGPSTGAADRGTPTGPGS